MKVVRTVRAQLKEWFRDMPRSGQIVAAMGGLLGVLGAFARIDVLSHTFETWLAAVLTAILVVASGWYAVEQRRRMKWFQRFEALAQAISEYDSLHPRVVAATADSVHDTTDSSERREAFDEAISSLDTKLQLRAQPPAAEDVGALVDAATRLISPSTALSDGPADQSAEVTNAWAAIVRVEQRARSTLAQYRLTHDNATRQPPAEMMEVRSRKNEALALAALVIGLVSAPAAAEAISEGRLLGTVELTRANDDETAVGDVALKRAAQTGEQAATQSANPDGSLGTVSLGHLTGDDGRPDDETVYGSVTLDPAENDEQPTEDAVYGSVTLEPGGTQPFGTFELEAPDNEPFGTLELESGGDLGVVTLVGPDSDTVGILRIEPTELELAVTHTGGVSEIDCVAYYELLYRLTRDMVRLPSEIVSSPFGAAASDACGDPLVIVDQMQGAVD